MSKPLKIVFIGAGNVSTHLAGALQKAGNKIIQIISRSNESAIILAKEFDCEYSTEISELNNDCDIIIISVSDKMVSEVVEVLDASDKLIVHTSGTLPDGILSKASSNYGVFYPLQTFTKNTKVGFTDIPILIEANSEVNLNILEELASGISEDVRVINSGQREIIHLTAVIVNNFTNLNYTVAQYILEKNNLPFDVLKPLIMETAKKVLTQKPSEIQTGPAFREDKGTILKHIEMLSDYPDYKDIYEIMSGAIAHHKEKK
jgi:predicted short-subunit dehydrogenase-like oxidoreductase (DUF2520 family)